MLTALLSGITNCHNNSEKFLVFPLVILQPKHSIQRSCDIKKPLEWRLD
jgi:hypothetical protein